MAWNPASFFTKFALIRVESTSLRSVAARAAARVAAVAVVPPTTSAAHGLVPVGPAPSAHRGPVHAGNLVLGEPSPSPVLRGPAPRPTPPRAVMLRHGERGRLLRGRVEESDRQGAGQNVGRRCGRGGGVRPGSAHPGAGRTSKRASSEQRGQEGRARAKDLGEGRGEGG
jgi:hypothetical protein